MGSCPFCELEQVKAERDELDARNSRLIDAFCHYRFVALKRGASPDEMLNSHDKEICTSGSWRDGEVSSSFDVSQVWEENEHLTAERDRLAEKVERAKEYATSLGDHWEEMEGGRDGIRTWEQCTHCRATRNDTRNGSENDESHRKWCPSMELLAILSDETKDVPDDKPELTAEKLDAIISAIDAWVALPDYLVDVVGARNLLTRLRALIAEGYVK
jgi:hypothetical protein